MKEAIKKAMLGGWNPRGVTDAILNRRLVKGTYFVYEDSPEYGFDILDFEVVLDRNFWIALGKQQRWDTKPPLNKKEWKKEWHNCIEHISIGKPLDDFFDNLLK